MYKFQKKSDNRACEVHKQKHQKCPPNCSYFLKSDSMESIKNNISDSYEPVQATQPAQPEQPQSYYKKHKKQMLEGLKKDNTDINFKKKKQRKTETVGNTVRYIDKSYVPKKKKKTVPFVARTVPKRKTSRQLMSDDYFAEPNLYYDDYSQEDESFEEVETHHQPAYFQPPVPNEYNFVTAFQTTRTRIAIPDVDPKPFQVEVWKQNESDKIYEFLCSNLKQSKNNWRTENPFVPKETTSKPKDNLSFSQLEKRRSSKKFSDDFVMYN